MPPPAFGAPPGTADGKLARRPVKPKDLGQKLKETILANAPPMTANATNQISKLQDDADQLTRKIELERRHVVDLDRQIAEMNQTIMHQRANVGGVFAGRENNRKINMQVKMLENRLEKAMQKYNAAVARNNDLRQKIDDLRRERLTFDSIYQSLMRDLAEKKRDVAQIMEVSNKAYEAKDAAMSEMARLKTQAEREQQMFEMEWKELGRIIDHDRKQRDFNKTRKTDKEDIKQQVAKILEEEKKLRQKVIRGNWSIVKDKAQQLTNMEKVANYGEAFAAIQEATGISDIDELVTSFIHAEDENFRLFRYVDELTREIHAMEAQVSTLRGEIARFRGGTSTDLSRKKLLTEIEQKLQETETRTEAQERKYTDATAVVATLKEGVEAIFAKLGCDKSENDTLSEMEGVTETNIMEYLGMIEERTNAILYMFAQSQSLATGRAAAPGAAVAVLGQGPTKPTGSALVKVEPPSTMKAEVEESSDESEDEEKDYKFLSRDELTVKAMKSIGRREMSKRRGHRASILMARVDSAPELPAAAPAAVTSSPS